MTLTQSRVIQYIGIILVAGLIAAGYWYFSVRAGVKTNTSVSQPGGTGRLDSGLAGYWRLDETTGSSASDSSTNANTGTLQNMENGDWGTGRIGNGLTFDGVNEYINAGSGASLQSSIFTYAAWINPSGSGNRTIKGNSSSAGPQFRITTTGALEFLKQANYSYDTTTATVANSTWSHVALTYNNISGDYIFYINGAPVAPVGDGNSTDTFTFSSAEIGAYGSGSGDFFSGSMDEVRMYSRVLSPDEVSQLYSLTSPTSVDTGLKGYWSFNAPDINGTTAYDRSGAGNTGTLTNGPTVTEGKVGQALSFDGTDDNVTVADTTDFTGSALTVAFWKKDTGVLQNRAFVTKSTGADRSWSIEGDDVSTGNGDSAVRFYVANGLSDVSQSGVTPSVMEAGKWHHVVAVFNGAGSGNSGRMQIYIDGVAQTLSFTGTIPSSLQNNSVGLRVGEGGVTTSLFLGSMDEVRAYNRALTAAEVKGLYDTGQTDKLGTSAGQAQGTGRLDSGLAGYWKLDENTGTSTADASTNASTGTLTNGPTWTTGQIGSAVNFDGTDDYITDPGATAVDIRDSLSLATWAKFDSFPASGQEDTLIFNSTGGNYIYELELYNNSGAYFLDFTPGGGGSDNFSQALPITTGTWYHMAVSYDAQSNAVNLYLDGSPVGTLVETVAGGYAGGTGTLYFGSVDGSSQFLDGQMDEVRIYNRALSSDEMANLSRLTTPMNVDTSLEGYWSFNGGDVIGTTAYDRSGAGNTGTLQDNAVGSQGIVGQAISLDGSFDRVDVGDMPTLEGQSALTISSWVRPSTLVDYAGILCKYSSTTSDTCLQAGGSGVGSNTAINATIRNGSDAYGYTVNGKLSVGTWTHVTMVFDGSLSGNANRLKVYVNGVQETLTFSGTIPATTVSNAQNVMIGRTGGASNYWNGKLDEIRAYNRALTAAEIQAQYAAAAPDKVNTSVSQPQGSGRLDSGLLGYWKLDETTGSSAADASTNGNAGTLTNMENGDWTTGRINNGLTFDGTNEYITMGDINAMDGVTQLTVSAWAKSSSLTTQRGIVTKSNCNGITDSGTFEISAGYTSGKAEFCIYPSGDTPTTAQCVTAANTMDDGSWHHLTGTYDGANMTLYMDGVVSASQAAAVSDLSANSVPVTVGTCNGGNYWNDMIDEVRVYNRAFSHDEVGQLYRLTAPTGVDTGLKGYWSFNGQDVSGTTAYDRSGAGNNGTLTNGPTAIRGKVGQALSFDGTDDYVTEAAINLSSTNKASVALWLYQSSFGTGDNLAFEVTADTNGNTTGFYLNPNSSGSCNSYISLALRGNTGVNSACYTRPSAGEWHHYVAILDKSQSVNEVDLYIDGVLQTATSRPATNNNNNTTDLFGNDPWYIMSRAGSSLFNAGKVDEFRIYNRILTAAEIKSLYQTGK